jgi:hypothetical protein
VAYGVIGLASDASAWGGGGDIDRQHSHRICDGDSPPPAARDGIWGSGIWEAVPRLLIMTIVILDGSLLQNDGRTFR